MTDIESFGDGTAWVNDGQSMVEIERKSPGIVTVRNITPSVYAILKSYYDCVSALEDNEVTFVGNFHQVVVWFRQRVADIANAPECVRAAFHDNRQMRITDFLQPVAKRQRRSVSP